MGQHSRCKRRRNNPCTVRKQGGDPGGWFPTYPFGFVSECKLCALPEAVMVRDLVAGEVVLPPFLGAGRCWEAAVTGMCCHVDAVVPEVLNTCWLIVDQRPPGPSTDTSAPAAAVAACPRWPLPLGGHLPRPNMWTSGSMKGRASGTCLLHLHDGSMRGPPRRGPRQ